jgi:DNA-binding NtrC family response regulator
MLAGWKPGSAVPADPISSLGKTGRAGKGGVMVFTRSPVDPIGRGRRSRLLVVEGDGNIQKMIWEELKAHFHEVHFEQSIDGAEKRILEDAPFDAILIDLFDPVERRCSLISLVKQRCSTTEVVFISRLSDKHLWLEMMQRGAYDFLAKPLDREEFRRTVINASEKAMRSSAERHQGS